MNEPYSAPESDLIGNAPEPQKRRWKLFFWLILVLEILSLIDMFSDESAPAYKLILECVVYSMVLLGLFGFAYHKRIFVALVWRLVLPLVFFYDLLMLITSDWQEVTELKAVEGMYVVIGLLVIILLPLMLIQYYALFRYGFKSAFIWNSEKHTQ